jgi:hypothetical protein
VSKSQFTEEQLKSRPELFAFVKRMAYNCVEYDYFDRKDGWLKMPCNLEMFMLHAEYDQAFDLYNTIYKNKKVKEYMLVNFVVENAFLLKLPEIEAEMDEAYADKQK